MNGMKAWKRRLRSALLMTADCSDPNSIKASLALQRCFTEASIAPKDKKHIKHAFPNHQCA